MALEEISSKLGLRIRSSGSVTFFQNSCRKPGYSHMDMILLLHSPNLRLKLTILRMTSSVALNLSANQRRRGHSLLIISHNLGGILFKQVIFRILAFLLPEANPA